MNNNFKEYEDRYINLSDHKVYIRKDVQFSQLKYIEFGKFVLEQISLFKNWYNSCGSIENVINSMKQEEERIFGLFAKQCTADYVANGVLGYNEEFFIDKFLPCLEPFNEPAIQMLYQYCEITGNEEQIRAFRELKAQQGSRYIGFGYGIRGAINATAGRVASDLLNGAVNAVANGITAVQTKNKLISLYQDESILENLCNGLGDALLLCFDCYAEQFNNDFLQDTEYRFYTSEEINAASEKYETIANNISNSNLSDEDKLEKLFSEIKGYSTSQRMWYEIFCLLDIWNTNSENQLKEVQKFVYFTDEMLLMIGFNIVSSAFNTFIGAKTESDFIKSKQIIERLKSLYEDNFCSSIPAAITVLMKNQIAKVNEVKNPQAALICISDFLCMFGNNFYSYLEMPDVYFKLKNIRIEITKSVLQNEEQEYTAILLENNINKIKEIIQTEQYLDPQTVFDFFTKAITSFEDENKIAKAIEFINELYVTLNEWDGTLEKIDLYNDSNFHEFMQKRENNTTKDNEQKIESEDTDKTRVQEDNTKEEKSFVKSIASSWIKTYIGLPFSLFFVSLFALEFIFPDGIAIILTTLIFGITMWIAINKRAEYKFGNNQLKAKEDYIHSCDIEELHLYKELPEGTNGSGGSNSKYFLMGIYPQTIKPVNVIIDESKSYQLFNLNCYAADDNCLYAKVPVSHLPGFGAPESYPYFSDGTKIKEGKAYYFRVEPIKWRIIDDKMNLAICEDILFPVQFATKCKNRIERESEKIIYSNNFEYSNIRSFCNSYSGDGLSFENSCTDNWEEKGFSRYSFFMKETKDKIKKSRLDNRPLTTVISEKDYPATQSRCNITEDKIFILSKNETRKLLNEELKRKPTDFALANGCFATTLDDHCGKWWLRSAYEKPDANSSDIDYVQTISTNGDYSYDVSRTQYIGFVPAIRLNI